MHQCNHTRSHSKSNERVLELTRVHAPSMRHRAARSIDDRVNALTGGRGNLLLDVVLVLETEDADDDATASGCCLSHGEYGVVRARRTASRMAENDGGEHHPHPPILISHTVRAPVVFPWLQVTWAPTDTNQGTSGHLRVTTRGRGGWGGWRRTPLEWQAPYSVTMHRLVCRLVCRLRC